MKTLFLTFIIFTSIAKANYVSKVDSFISMNDLTSISTNKVCSTNNLIKSDMSGIYKRKESRIKTIHSVVSSVSKEFNINPCIVLSMIAQESSFDGSNISNKNAKGLMQVIPSTKKHVINLLKNKLNTLITSNLNSGLNTNEITDIIVGSKYFQTLVVKFKNNQDIAVIAYNEGPSTIQIKINKKIAFGQKHNHLIKVKENLALLAMN